MTETVQHTHECHVRWSDVDAYGHVNNVKYFEYFQEARINFLSMMANVHGDADTLVVARLVVDYKLPIFYRKQPYPIHTRVAERGESSFELDSEITDGVRVLSVARAVLVAFDAEAQRSRPLTGSEREFLGRLIGS